MPTAMPVPPLTNKLGKSRGKDRGLGAGLVVVRMKSTVSLSMSIISAAPRCWSRARCYRIDAGGSPSTEPKLPCHRSASHASPKAAPCGQASGKSPDRRADDSCPSLADDLRALEVLAIRLHAELVHRVKNAPLRRLQPVARIGSAREMMTDME